MLRWALLLGLVVAVPAGAQPIGNVPYSAFPNCTDTGGQHLNIARSTGAISCGTTSGTPTGSAGGDLSGTYPNPTVANVNGVAYPASPSTNKVPVVTGSNTVTYEFVPNAALANPSVTVNGTGCTLGSSCTPPAGNLVVGTTGVNSGTTTRVLYDNAGTLGEYAVTGSGSVVLGTSPSIASPTVTGAFTATGLVTNADLANSSMTLAGHSVSLGGTQAFACGDLSNGATGCSTATGTSGATIPLLNGKNTWSAQQAVTPTTLNISTATYTPDGSSNNYTMTLVHASCPCTLANPSATPVAGTGGQIVVIQSATGSDAIGTWGSDYEAPGGTSTLTLSTAANAVDILSYYVRDSTHIELSLQKAFSH